MNFDGRITRLEREVGCGDGGRTVTCVVIIDDTEYPVDPEELEAFLDALRPADGSELALFHMSDNGRGECGPHVSYSGHDRDGSPFTELGPMILEGHLVPRSTD